MISTAKLWLFHILTKRFFRCVRTQYDFLDYSQTINVKICTLQRKVCISVLFILTKTVSCWSYQPKPG